MNYPYAYRHHQIIQTIQMEKLNLVYLAERKEMMVMGTGDEKVLVMKDYTNLILFLH